MPPIVIFVEASSEQKARRRSEAMLFVDDVEVMIARHRVALGGKTALGT